MKLFLRRIILGLIATLLISIFSYSCHTAKTDIEKQGMNDIQTMRELLTPSWCRFCHPAKTELQNQEKDINELLKYLLDPSVKKVITPMFIRVNRSVIVDSPYHHSRSDTYESEKVNLEHLSCHLAAIGEPAIPALIKALADRNNKSNDRWYLTMIIARIKSNKVVPGLITVIENEPDGSSIKINCIELLGYIGDASAIHFLKEVLGKYRASSYKRLYPIILVSLIRCGDSEASNQLIKFMDENPDEQSWIQWLIDTKGNKLVIEAGIRYLKNKNSDIRQLARWSLYQITGLQLSLTQTTSITTENEDAIQKLWAEWWGENKEYLYWSMKGRFGWDETYKYSFVENNDKGWDNGWRTEGFKIDEEAKKLGISVNEKTGKWLDPKDGHELTSEEIEQIKKQKDK